MIIHFQKLLDTDELKYSTLIKIMTNFNNISIKFNKKSADDKFRRKGIGML